MRLPNAVIIQAIVTQLREYGSIDIQMHPGEDIYRIHASLGAGDDRPMITVDDLEIILEAVEANGKSFP